MHVFLAFFNPLAPIMDPIVDLSKSILIALAGATHSFGWTLVIFAACVKIVLWPLTQMQFKSMAEMQRVAPRIKKLQAQYKGNPQKLNQETMALYKEHGVNPMAGCLPLLIQMPILFSLYYAIQSPAMDELKKQGWLWMGWLDSWFQSVALPLYDALAKLLPFKEVVSACPKVLAHLQTCTLIPPPHPLPHGYAPQYDLTSYNVFAPDLAHPDLLILALYVVSMYFSMRWATVTPADPAQAQQQKIMAFISPVMIAFIGRSWPSALIIYWFSFNVFNTLQSVYLLRKYTKQPVPATDGAVTPKNVTPAREDAARSNGKLPGPKSESPTAPRKKRSRR
ncbi:MAG: YidC/Oxa1 family membrane protein insertase [Vulcanimicrobiaceae bacterium]